MKESPFCHHSHVTTGRRCGGECVFLGPGAVSTQVVFFVCSVARELLVPYPDSPTSGGLAGCLKEEESPPKKAQGGGDVDSNTFKKPSDDAVLEQLSRKALAESTERKIGWGGGPLSAVAFQSPGKELLSA